VDSYSGDGLLTYLTQQASYASPYQPLLIAALIRAGGRAPAVRLAELLLINDPVVMSRARRTLMRWPLRTFRKHAIADYDAASKEFVLPVEFASDQQRQHALDVCDALAAGWAPRGKTVSPSLRYALIEHARGRCQACGAPGSETALDIDHIVPRAAAKNGKVKLGDGRTVPVDDRENLQVLCAACNRGKRDLGTYDFRPSLPRLAETMNTAAARAEALGYSAAQVAAARAAALSATGGDGAG
jgi:5-methylcytosine-specific restriction endonuclease McrA